MSPFLNLNRETPVMKARNVFLVLLLSLCVPACFGQTFDADGNPPGAILGADGGPGTTISTINHSITGNKHSDLDAAGGQLLAISGYDGQAQIYIIDWFTGSQISTVPIDNAGDFGVGYDTLRGIYLTTNSSSPSIKGFDGVNPAPLFTTPMPFNPVGIAYDANRDVYWVTFWQTNSVYGYYANNFQVFGTISTSAVGCTRPAGAAYDTLADQVIVGGRDQNSVFVLDAATGSLVTSFGAPDGSNNPQGVATFPSGASLWASSWNSSNLFQVASDHSLDLMLDLSIPGNLTITVTNVPLGADCRLFWDILPAPYTGSGPFNGASISPQQIAFTLNWVTGLGPFSTLGPVASVVYGPYPAPPGIHLNAAIVDFVVTSGVIIEPPIIAVGGTTL